MSWIFPFSKLHVAGMGEDALRQGLDRLRCRRGGIRPRRPLRGARPGLAGDGLCASVATAEPAVVVETLEFTLETLDGGEIIILAVKPSVFSPLLEALPVMLLALFGGAVLCGGWLGTFQGGFQAGQIVLAFGLLRLCYAILSWSATWYVLTNRRVLRISGIRVPTVRGLRLAHVRNTLLTHSILQKWLSIGAITCIPTQSDLELVTWRNVAQPEETHRILRKAIKDALDSAFP